MPFLTFVAWVPGFFLGIGHSQPLYVPLSRINVTIPIAPSISSLKTNCRASTEKYKAKNVARIVSGNPKENKFNCGADFVMKPMPKLIKNKMLTMGSTMVTAEVNKKSADVRPFSTNKLLSTKLPIGNFSKLLNISSRIIKCPFNAKIK